MYEKERSDLLNKIQEWQDKSKKEIDPFNKYISIFIAYNIFYNLLAKTENPTVKLISGDKERSIRTVHLLGASDNNKLFSLLHSELEIYLNSIPVYDEEYWPFNGTRIPISDELRKAFRGNKTKETIDLLLKWLYSVRCNLVHGDKNYQDDKQKELLEMSSKLLDAILKTLLPIYVRKFVSP